MEGHLMSQKPLEVSSTPEQLQIIVLLRNTLKRPIWVMLVLYCFRCCVIKRWSEAVACIQVSN